MTVTVLLLHLHHREPIGCLFLLMEQGDLRYQLPLRDPSERSHMKTRDDSTVPNGDIHPQELIPAVDTELATLPLVPEQGQENVQ